MKLAKFDAFLLKFLYLLAAGIIVCLVIEKDSLTSLLFYMTFPVTVLLWLRTVRRTLTGMDLTVLGTIALAFICVLVDAGVNNADLGFSYVRKLIIFSMTLLFFQTAYRMRVDRDIVDFINGVIDLLTVFLILMFALQTRQMFVLNNRITNYLTFRMGNPNMTGLFLASLYMLELYRIFTPERWYWKLVHIIMAIFLVVFILMTQSRNCLVAVVLFTLICGWLIFRSKRKLRLGKNMAFLIAMLPMVFAIIYVFVIYTPWVQRLFEFLVGEGKNLDSRMKIWEPAITNILQSPIVGAYYTISEGTGMSQMHNSHLDIAASYGIPVLVLVCLLLRNYLYQKGKIYESKQGFIYILGFACAIVLGIGEAALFSGGLGFYVFIGSFLLLARWENE